MSCRTSPILVTLLCGGVLAAQDAPVVWRDGALEGSLALAQTRAVPLLIYFWMEGSAHCADLWGTTLTAPEAAAELGNFVCHSADATSVGGADLVQRFHVTTLPTLLVITPHGEVDDAVVGFIPLADFVTEMQRSRAGQQTVTALRAAAAAAPDDLDQRLALAQKFAFVGRVGESAALEASIRSADPRGATAVGAGLWIVSVRDEILESASDATDPNTWDIAPMRRRLSELEHAPTRFSGWNWMARTFGERGDRKARREAWARAMTDAPAGGGARWGAELLAQLWSERSELQAGDKRLALAVATVLNARAEQRQAHLARPDSTPAPVQLADEDELTVGGALAAAAQGLWIAGKKSEARRLIGRALELEPDDADLARLRDELRR